MEEFSEELIYDCDTELIDEFLRCGEGLEDAFKFEDTKQGLDHWVRICMGDKPLDDESRSYLIRLRDAVLAREKGK